MDILRSVLLLQLMLIQEMECLKSLVIKVPEYVRVNESVTLSCDYDLENVALYTIKWYWNGVEFYRFVPKESPPSKAFYTRNLHVDLEESGMNAVTLRSVQKDHSGVFKCEVSADAPLFHTELKGAVMNVIDVPIGAPQLEVSTARIEVGKRITATCAVTATIPPANLTWQINNEFVDSSEPYVRIRPNRVVGGTLESRIELVALKPYFTHGPMVLRCDATLFDVWHTLAENFLHEDVALLSSVLLSTSSLTHGQDNFDFFGLSAALRIRPSNTVPLVTILCYLYFLFKR